jgi:hypothetical protein
MSETTLDMGRASNTTTGRSKFEVEMDFLGDHVDVTDMDDHHMTDSERDEFLSALVDEESHSHFQDMILPSSIQSSHTLRHHSNHRHSKPVPIHISSSSNNNNHHNNVHGYPQSHSQASSHGSSGSAFLSSVLNAADASPWLSHTPPCASSYEASHFGKRARSGSLSGRIRSASEYLEEKGLLDRHTKGILKDLIIIGDPALQHAIDRYESGDPSVLEQMIESGALQERLPKDLDILGDLDLDFLNVHDDGMGDDDALDDTIEPLPDYMHSSTATATTHTNAASTLIPNPLAHTASLSKAPSLVSPAATYDDGIGDLDFTGDLDYTTADFMPPSKEPSAAASPMESTHMSEYERRMRSNSLFSALLNDPKSSTSTSTAATTTAAAFAKQTPHNPLTTATNPHSDQYGRWMDKYLDYPASEVTSVGDSIQKKLVKNRRSSAPSSVLAATLEAVPKKAEKPEKKTPKVREKKPKKSDTTDGTPTKKQQAAAAAALEEALAHEHVPGSGLPRSLSDPHLRTSLDDCGLMHVDRPDGWVGAYSPDSRKVRIDRYMQKRNHRVWTKVRGHVLCSLHVVYFYHGNIHHYVARCFFVSHTSLCG